MLPIRLHRHLWLLKSYISNRCSSMIHEYLYNHGCCDTSFQYPDRNLYSSIEHPISYCLIFNLNIIMIIFRLGQYQSSCISSSTRDLHSFSLIDNNTSYWRYELCNIMYLNSMKYSLLVSLKIFNTTQMS